jgi:hypothetical protein
VRISATQLESYRLWRAPDQEWMSEEELAATIRGEFKGNHKVSLGSAFGQVLEDPDSHVVQGGFRAGAGGEFFDFGTDVMEPCLELVDRRGVFEAKAVKSYGPHDVSSKADHLLGGHLSEFKTTLSTFDFDKYANSCQWRFMADAFKPTRITYRVFCLSEGSNGVIELRSIESFDLYPYPGLHRDCQGLVDDFCTYVTAKGLDGFLTARQAAA